MKLPNGNIASRVLPVRIYDLYADDIDLCESVLGGVLRGVEFIYKGPGVNSPLKPDDNESIENIFDIQESVSRSITETLKVKLNPEERKQTGNMKAYDLYLLGRYYWNKRTREGLMTSIEHFTKAVESDHNYALAYAVLADAYHVCADWSYFQMGHIDEAIDVYQKTLTVKLSYEEYENNAAKIYFS